MCTFTELLQTSKIFGPLVRLAHVPAETLARLGQDSGVLRLLTAVLSPIGSLGATLKAKLKTSSVALLPMVPFAGVLLLLASLAFLGTGAVGVLTWTLLLLSLVVLWVLGPDLKKQLSIVDVLILAFIASAFISAGFSSYLKYSLVGLAKMTTFLAGYVSFRVFGVVWEKHRWPLLAVAVLLAMMGLFQSLVGFYQFTHHVEARATWVDPTTNPELNLTRIFGTLQPANPNLLAGFLIPCLAAALGVTVWQLSAWLSLLQHSGNRLRFLLQALLVAAGSISVAIILVALVLTGSRGGFLALGGIAVVFFALLGHLVWNPGVQPATSNANTTDASQSLSHKYFSRKKLKMLWVLILVGSIAAASVVVLKSPQLQHRITSIFSMRSDSSISYRLNVYNSVKRMIADNPVIGIGPGNDTFKRVYGYYMVPGFNALGAYSVPLEITAEQGFLGLSIFLLMLLCLAIRTLYFLDTDRPLFEKMAVLMLFCGIVGSLLYGVFDTIWYRPAVNLLFWLYVALLVQWTQPLRLRSRAS